MGATKMRKKGKDAELEVAAEIRRLFKVEARRSKQYDGDAGPADLTTAIPEVHFEVKRREQTRLYEWMDKLIEEAGDDVPVLLHRQNNRQWLAVVPLDELPRLAVQLFLTLAETQ